MCEEEGVHKETRTTTSLISSVRRGTPSTPGPVPRTPFLCTFQSGLGSKGVPLIAVDHVLDLLRLMAL